MEAQSRRVFLAEDDDDLAELLSRKLRGAAWRVERARTKREAIERLRGDRFDAVVLDYLLPDGSGLDLLTLVREVSPATPVLFLTGHGSEDVAMQAMGLGAADYMQKTGDMWQSVAPRLDALLARTSDLAQAARVVPVSVSPSPSAPPSPPLSSPAVASARGVTPDEARAAIESVVRGDVIGAAVFDGSGRPIAALLPKTIEATTLGASLVQVHAQAGAMARVHHLVARGYRFVLETDEGVIAASMVPGRAIVAVVVDPVAGSDGAESWLATLAKRVG